VDIGRKNSRMTRYAVLKYTTIKPEKSRYSDSGKRLFYVEILALHDPASVPPLSRSGWLAKRGTANKSTLP